MRFSAIINVCLCCLLLFSCKSAFEYNQAGMEKLNKELIKEFGADTWYTSIRLLGNKGADDQVIVDLSRDPNSLQQERWVQSVGFWNKDADITLSIQGAEPKSFMFRLDKEVSLSKLGSLIEQSRKKLQEDKHIEDGEVNMAQVESSNQMNSREQGIHYAVTLTSKKAGKSFYFIYKLDGSLKSIAE